MMGYMMTWYEQLGGREQSEHVESLELFGRMWSIGDKVFSLYEGWGEIKAIWRYPLGNNKTHAWQCNAMFQSGEFEVCRLYSLNIWMTEDSFASERGERVKPKNVTKTQSAVTARSVTKTQPAVTARSVTHGTSICVCAFCGEGFKSNRAHARTCSPKCRKALSRKQT